jgi:hypothetical protein
MRLNRTDSDGDILQFYKGIGTVGSIGTAGGDITIGTGDTGLTFEDSADVIHPINQSTGSARDNAIDLGKSAARFKDLYLSGGVYLGGTGAANHLDDYEEGTFTPTVSSGITSPTYAVQTGRYTKIGNRVFYDLYIQTTGGTTNSSHVIFLDFLFQGWQTQALQVLHLAIAVLGLQMNLLTFLYQVQL